VLEGTTRRVCQTGYHHRIHEAKVSMGDFVCVGNVAPTLTGVVCDTLLLAASN
jgi:hypothetical protein